MTVQILTGDCRDVLATLPDRSVHCCVTSPPYFGLRSYFEDGLKVDPNLSDDKLAWLMTELARRGIHAR